MTGNEGPLIPKNLLIVRTDRLGDVVLTLSMARALKHANPEFHVSFFARSYTAPIISHSPDVDQVFIVEDDTSLSKLIHTFRSAKADAAFFPSPQFRLALAAFLARIPKRIGTGYRWYSFLFTDKIFEHRRTAEHHEAVYNLHMLDRLGIPWQMEELPRIELGPEERGTVKEWLAANLNSTAFAVLHITNGGSTKRWPVQNFITLGQKLFERYAMTIILTGTRQETEELRATQSAIGTGKALVFAGCSLPELAALLERAALVMATGTGPGHLAAALGTPTIGIFSLPPAVSKERWSFRGPRAKNIAPEPIAECPNCRDCTCMERLEVQTVLDNIATMLS